MTTTLFLVRHGETKWNALGKFQGCKDIELSEEGLFQVKLLKDKYENSFDYIYSIPLNRALDTTNILCSNRNIFPKTEPALREINFEECKYLTKKN